jgi:hypothetical protein
MDVPNIEAIYSAEFTLNGSQFGRGVLVLNQGHIHGADGIYAYKGLYLMAEGSFSAVIVAERYTDLPKGGLDLPAHFRLIMSGGATTDGLTFVSALNGQSAQVVRVGLKRISHLVDH